MTRFLIALLAAGAAAPALAQHAGHSAAAEAPPVEAHQDHAAADPACPPEHAAMGHCTPATPHGAATQAPPIGPAPAEAMAGPEHAADAVWDRAAMGASRETLRREHGDMPVSKVMIDRLEWQGRRGENGYAWDMDAWHGGDVDKLWLKSEGEGGSRLEHGEVQALWSHAIDPWFDLQLGLRQDFGSGPDRSWLAAGVEGLAPYWFEIDAAVFVSSKGEVVARAEAEYDLRITQRLILQPRAELNLSAQESAALRLGAGLSKAALGLRLRYELDRRFAPYAGVEYERAFGDTADFRRAAGERRGGWNVLMGVRAWF
ncbi:copper resistance protein B [Sphingomonas parva]|uniref:Copper resistance protein B n=1 Tax=Sphingomonas parva TaxID=2555898 RepID=A0A4Y8ZUC3_9SPHN|nr:copper resistance protein B [Sphingomonas parva]TFI59623.1 copper resistance protein B [Sphingomonas parva]